MFATVKHFAKAKRELCYCEVKECKIPALVSLRRRPTFVATKVFASEKQDPRCSKAAEKVQDQSLVHCFESNLRLSEEVRQGEASLC